MIPRLPEKWDNMALRHIKAFNQDFDIEVSKENANTRIKVFNHKSGNIVYDDLTNLKKPIHISF